MAYCTLSDVQTAAGGPEKLRQLTDLENAGKIDSDLVDEKISEADSLIDSYFEKRYATPISDADLALAPIVKRTSARLAVFALREDREALTPEQDERQAQRITWLQGVAEGRISLGISPRPQASDHVRAEFGTDRGASTAALTREKFGGWT